MRLINTKKIILIAIIPLILSIGMIPALQFADAEVGPDTLCREGYVIVHRFQQNDYACMNIEIAKSWESLKTGQIVNSQPVKQFSPPSQISEDAQTTSMSDNPQMMERPSANHLKCDIGLNLVINGMDGSTACVRPSSVQKLIESGWISIGSDFVQETELETEQISSESIVTTTQSDFLPSENDRAMYFVARFSEGLIPYTEMVKSNFLKFIPFKDQSPSSAQIHPENALPNKPPLRFLLETLPSKDNIGYYNAIDDYFQTDSTLFKEFDASIDVVTGDGTVLQTWEYRNCDLEDYTVYLQDNVFFDRFQGKSGAEIRERSIFQCDGLSLVAPEN